MSPLVAAARSLARLDDTPSTSTKASTSTCTAANLSGAAGAQRGFLATNSVEQRQRRRRWRRRRRRVQSRRGLRRAAPGVARCRLCQRVQRHTRSCLGQTSVAMLPYYVKRESGCGPGAFAGPNGFAQKLSRAISPRQVRRDQSSPKDCTVAKPSRRTWYSRSRYSARISGAAGTRSRRVLARIC